MSDVLTQRIQALLRKRLGEVGVAADLRNDDQAIAEICRELGLPREVVASELDEMRTQAAVRIMGRERLPISFLALKPALHRAMAAPSRESSPQWPAAADEPARDRRRDKLMDVDLG